MPPYEFNDNFSVISSLKAPIYIIYTFQSISTVTFSMASNNTVFQDLLPLMADKLGGERLMGELCNGFQLLMDPVKRVITFDSLKKNAVVLGLADMTDDDLMSILKEGDLDGDGVLSQMEFCVLMFRLSPELMKLSWLLLDEVLK
ncbi:putative calcium-binding protein KIC/PBP1/KRP1 [Helianthus annuus]|nr:putative calcium-binding protein KIC/PBP1/KRP1 [Helianthus annuus]